MKKIKETLVSSQNQKKTLLSQLPQNTCRSITILDCPEIKPNK